MEQGNTFSYEELPLWGIKDIDIGDLRDIGDFLSLPKSGFFLCRRGSITVGDHDRFYTLTPGHMIIYPIKASLFIKDCSEDIGGTIGITDLENLLEIASKTVDASNSMDIITNPSVELSPEELRRIDEIADILRRRAETGEGEQLSILSLWNALCYEIAGIYKRKCNDTKSVRDRSDEVLLRFLFSLKENVRQERQVQFYAAQQCLSTRYFSTIIKKRTGFGPLEIITKAAMKEVVELLETPSVSIKEISYALNFPSPSFFIRWFKHLQGMTPNAYRMGQKSFLLNLQSDPEKTSANVIVEDADSVTEKNNGKRQGDSTED